jgi:8-oxo-dGTP pyrophosphatase MutT (NUDIX family)
MTFSDPNFAASPANATKNCATPQIAALCWRVKRGKIEVLLITSRDTGRWVIPKGWPMSGCTDPQAAKIEAWEEAGVEGEIDDIALGAFYYDKRYVAKATQTCEVTVYPLRVARLVPKFPEQNQRRRKWFSAQKAAKLVDELGLAGLILRAQTVLQPRKGA